MSKISVVLATYNEEKNIGACLTSVASFADEIIIVDGESTDNTVAIAKTFPAKVVSAKNHAIFHINKQKALELASFEWILQLDADERVSPALGKEIQKVLSMSTEELTPYQRNLPQRKLFERHTKLLEERDGVVGMDTLEYAAFFVPRLNYFLGRYLRYGGVYPDGVIRLVKKGKAHFSARDVHEQIVVDGKVGWLSHDLLHFSDPTFQRYLLRWGRYTALLGKDIKSEKRNEVYLFCKYMFVQPVWWFLLTFFRHKGFLDSWQGFVFSFFSSLRFPVAYIKSRK